MWSVSLRDKETFLGRFNRAFIPRQSRLHTWSLKTQRRGNNVPAGFFSAKVRTADLSLILYAPAKSTSKASCWLWHDLCFWRKGKQFVLASLDDVWRDYRYIGLSSSIYLAPWYQLQVLWAFTWLSSWSSLYKTKRSIDQTRRELFRLKNVTMKRMPNWHRISATTHEKGGVPSSYLGYKYRGTADDPFASRIGFGGTMKKCMNPSVAKYLKL